MLAFWRHGQLKRRGVARSRILPGTAGGCGRPNPQICRRCAFDELRAPKWDLVAIHVDCGKGGFLHAFLSGTRTARERCYPREIRPCMKPDHKRRRLQRLCSVLGSRIGAGVYAPGSAAARCAGSSVDPLRPHPDPWVEPLKLERSTPKQLPASDPDPRPTRGEIPSAALLCHLRPPTPRTALKPLELTLTVTHLRALAPPPCNQGEFPAHTETKPRMLFEYVQKLVVVILQVNLNV